MGERLEDVDGESVDKPDPETPRARDKFVVCTEPLSGLVCVFVDNWHRQRPPDGGRFGAGGERAEATTMSAIEWLEERTLLPRKTIKSVAARDPATGKPRGRRATTDLRVADALVAAIDQPQVFYDGTLRVIDRDEARRGCCGSSG